MRDFGKSLVRRDPDPSLVDEFLRTGQLARAIRRARAARVVIPQPVIDKVARAMFRAGRSGALLALMGVEDVRLPYDELTLLARTFEVRDYHTFLKQAHRLPVGGKLKAQVEEAIAIIEKKAPGEAAGWRRKFVP